MEGARAWGERIVPRAGGGLPAFFRLRPPSGHDELALGGVDTRAAADLLDRLVDPPADTAGLAASDRDRLLATLHRGLWGDRIVSSLQCAECGAMYDLSFELSALQAALEAARQPSTPVGDRTIKDGLGQCYHLPSADDEEQAATTGADAAAMLAAAINDDRQDDLAARLETLAPIIDIDLDAPCAECGAAALVRFDVQSYTLQRLLDERDGMLAEVHTIAAGYGWSLHEILGLERRLRRQFANRLGEAI